MDKLASAFEIAGGAGMSTERGTVVVTASGEQVQKSSVGSPANVVQLPKRKKSSPKKKTIITVTEDKAEVARAVVDSLNASAERSEALRLEEERLANERIQRQVSTGGRFDPMVASVLSQGVRSVDEQTTNKSSARLDVEQVARFSILSGSNLPNRFFFATQEGKEFLLDNSPKLNRILGSSVAKEEFRLTSDDFKSAISNREVIKDIYEREGVVVEQSLLQKTTDRVNNPSAMFPVPLPSEGVSYKELDRRAFLEVGGVLKDSLIEGGQAIGRGDFVTVSVANPNFPVGRGGDLKVDFLPRGLPSPEATAGAGMIAYSSATLFTNQLGVVGRVGTEVVDVALALPDFKRAIVNPSIYNKQIAKYEIADVLVDIYPVGTPNIRARPMLDVAVSADVKKSFDVRSVGAGRNSNTFNSGARAMSLGAPASNVEININDAISGNFMGSMTRLVDMTTDVNVNANINPNIFVNELPTRTGGRNVNAEINIDQNINVNENVNLNVNENVNLNVNENVNLNVNENVNLNQNVNANVNANINAFVNANLNQNINANLNLNLKSFGGRKGLTQSYGLFQARAKVKGVFRDVGSPTASFRDAFKAGSSFVENTASRTFKVKDVSSGLNVPLKGDERFYVKKTTKGDVLVERGAFAINSPGEFAQIRRTKIRKVRL